MSAVHDTWRGDILVDHSRTLLPLSSTTRPMRSVEHRLHAVDRTIPIEGRGASRIPAILD
jgi:hypothetical protein